MSILPMKTYLAAVLSVVALGGCVGETALENLPCPCASGWTCCEGDNVCVREGASCPGPNLLITPGSASVALGHTLSLTASEPVTWSVEEASAGQIDAGGQFTALLHRDPANGTSAVLATTDMGPFDGGLALVGDHLYLGRSNNVSAELVWVPLLGGAVEPIAGSIQQSEGMLVDGVGTAARMNHL